MAEPLVVEIWHDKDADLWGYRCAEIDVHNHVIGYAFSQEAAHAAALRDVGLCEGAQGRLVETVDA